VKQMAKIGFFGLVLMVASAATAMAQDAPAPAPGASAAGSVFGNGFGSGLGAGLVVIGAAAGIGRLAASALESMARQPEVAGSVQTAMIIAAALIEGFTFYALFICSQAK
jgi:F-type H+-transporting ATPase subunit c